MASARFDDIEDDTRAAIMRATFRALCEHGYANLTIQRIGDEFEMSKSLLYYHYDDKDELLLEFLAFLLHRLQEETPFEGDGTPESRLEGIIDHLVPVDPDADRLAFLQAMLELRTQAAHDPDYRAHFTRSDQYVREHIAAIIEDGIEQGVFAPVDAEEIAAVLMTLILGSMVRRVTVEDPDVEAVRETIDRFLATELRTSQTT